MQRPLRQKRSAAKLALLLVGSLAAAGDRLDAQPGEGDPGAAAAASDVLVVGTKVAPPFALRGEDGEWRGVAIELWAGIAEDLGLSYELREADLEGLLTGLEDGTLDLSVAALTVTAPRERRVDFSHAFHSSGLGIAVPAAGTGGWTAMLRNLLDPRLWTVVATLALVLFAAGFLVWLFERRKNPEQFEPGARGLGSAFWWSAVTMTTVGYGDKAPASLGGRVVALLWMFASVIVISSFTAAIASSLTVARLAVGIEGPEDLPGVHSATVTASTSERYLERRHLAHDGFATLEEALDAVAAGEADAVVYDEPILRYWTRSRAGGTGTAGRAGAARSRLQVLPETFERQDYAIALPEGSPLREPVNRALLQVIDDPAWQNVLARYLGE